MVLVLLPALSPVLVDAPLKVLAVIAIIVIGKTLAAVALVLVFRDAFNVALTVGASLAQIGEFSILAGLGVGLGLLPLEGQSLILAGALISIALNAVVFAAIEPLQAWLSARSPWVRNLEHRDDPLAELPMSVDADALTGHVIVVGYGRVGRRIIDALIQAHVARAGMLVIATPDSFDVRRMVESARTLNPSIEVVVRTHSDEEARLLETEKVGKVFIREHELATATSAHVLARVAVRYREPRG